MKKRQSNALGVAVPVSTRVVSGQTRNAVIVAALEK
jgi:hypothetical protein